MTVQEIIESIREMTYTEPESNEQIFYNNALYDVIEMLKKSPQNPQNPC